MAVPYTFAGATSSIPLSQLDTNFASTITLGNTAIQLGNTVTTLNNMTLANVTISSGNVTITNVTVTTANVTVGNITTLTGTSATYTNIASGNVTITGGTLNNVAIGGTTAASGAFTTLSASGAFSLTGDQVQISEGGTGQTTANAAFNALAPSQTGNSGKYLKTDGTDTSWDAIDINTADITGTLPILNGGTGQTTANAAFNALAPSQTSQSGKYLKTDGTNASWDALDISTADITGTLPIANGGTGLTALGTGVQTALGQNVTGSGGIVLATSPSLTTPNLGTPSAAVLTNATGLPLTTGVTGTLGVANGGTGITAFGTGVATALGQNVTGSGGIVLATSPSLTTPNLGTPSAATLTNATGLPISTGVSGLGTNVATALAVNVGTAGAFVVNGGALGTPSGGTLTNCTGYPTSALSGSINLATQVTGTLATTNGGTGLTSFTANGVVYASSTSALTTGSALYFDGTNLGVGTTSPVTATGYTGFTVRNNTNGGIIQTTDGTVDLRLQLVPATTGNIGTYSNHPVGFVINGTEGFRLTSTSLYTASGINVGIGTSSPSSLYAGANNLVVGGGSGSTGMTIYSGTAGVGRLFFADGTSGADAYRGWVEYGHVGNQMTLGTNGATAATLDSSGNLGLVVTPSAWGSPFLGAFEGKAGTALVGRSDAAQSFLFNNLYFNGTNYIRKATGYGNFILLDGYSGGIGFNIAGTGSGGTTASPTQAMTLDANGVLLVGSSSSDLTGTAKSIVVGNFAVQNAGSAGTFLQVVPGAANGTVDLKFDARTGAYPAATFWTSNTERARISSDGTFRVKGAGTAGSTDAVQFAGTAPASALSLTSGGNLLVNGGGSALGIGDQYVSILGTGGSSALLATSASGNNASAALFLAASTTSYTANIVDIRTGMASGTGFNAITYKSDTSTTRFNVAGNGDVTNTNNSYGAISDIKLKENITDATPKLASLNQLRVVNYNFKGSDLKQIGLVAQEVEQVFPGLVETSADRDAEGNDLGTTTKSVKYSVLVPMLLKAVQELTAMNDDLRARVAQLEAK